MCVYSNLFFKTLKHFYKALCKYFQQKMNLYGHTVESFEFCIALFR